MEGGWGVEVEARDGPVQVGDPAPDFSLPAAPSPERITLSELRGRPVVLLFFPLAFSGTCTEQMCRVAENWGRWEHLEATVLGISVDSPFVNVKFAKETGVPFPLLSDFNREASRAYGVLYDDFYGLEDVSRRAAFVIDARGIVAWSFVDDDADVIPPLDEIRAAVEGLA